MNTDKEKCEMIFKRLNLQNVGIADTFRLGKERPGEKARFLKVVLEEQSQRKDILAVAKNLKTDAIEEMKKIYIKKDVHPLISKEFYRLKTVEEQEKAKPENQGREVKYNADVRTITVDGIIIDSFRSQFF